MSADERGARMLEVPNWPNLEDGLLFWHHLPFSGTVWSLNPNFDTEFRRLFWGVSGPSYGLKCKKRGKKIRIQFFGFLTKT